MQDRHPIDSLFREALEGASSAPPSRIWNSLVQERERRRRIAVWRMRRNWGLALLLLILAGGGLYWSTWTRSAAVAEVAQVGTTDEVSPLPEGSKGGELAVRAEEQPDDTEVDIRKSYPVLVESTEPVFSPGLRSTDASPSGPGSPPLNSVPGSASSMQVGASGTVPSPSAGTRVRKGDLQVPAGGAGDDATAQEYIPVHVLAAATADIEATPIRPRAISPTATPPLLRPGPIAEAPYVLAPGRWWIAAQVGLYNVQRQWSGTPGRLTDALNGSEAWHSTIAVGGVIGRSWRSGFGVGVGVDLERSEQAFRHLDRQVHTENIINTHLVTLNTQVFVSSVDTTVLSIVDERWVDGLDRRTVMRTSAEAFWHKGLRRFRFGPRLGLGVDFTKVTSQGSVAYNEAEGRLERTTLPAAVISARYPIMVLGIAGFDLDYVLHEQWSVGVTPMGLFAIGPVGGRAPAYSSPTRVGTRFRLTYSLFR